MYGAIVHHLVFKLSIDMNSKITVLFACVLCCWIFPSLVHSRIVKPSHGVPQYQQYQPYQLQQQEQQTEQHEYKYEAHSDSASLQLPQAGAGTHKHHHQGTKHSVGNHHTHSGHSAEENHNDHHSHPKYKFSYHVEEHKTGDYKRHEEERDGDVTHGEYSLIEADGSLRTVKYTVDKEHGFQAIVVKSDGKKSRK